MFSVTLGYSRLHLFIYSRHKTEQDVIRCLIEVIKRLGGRCKIFKTDNMSAIVSCTKDGKHIHPSVKKFFDDLDSELQLCKVKSPETKGKCESANRFVNWIKAFDYKVENEEEIIHIIENHITNKCNQEKNQSTLIPPIALFNKEKEFLLPVGNKVLMENYITNHTRSKVQATLLVNYDGKGYSVPKKYLGQIMDLYVVSSELYIYHNKKLVTIHTITQKRVNYKSEHYKEGLSSALSKDTSLEDIEELALKNLSKLNKFGGN